MPQVYTYKVRDAAGKVVTGSLEAASSQLVAGKLREMGYAPISIDEQRGAAVRKALNFNVLAPRIKTKDVAVFSRQFATMINVGLSLVRSLGILVDQTESAPLKAVVEHVRTDVQSGMSLSASMAKHPQAFPRLYVAMVRAGESGGVLDQTLLQTADALERQVTLRRKIRSAMTYPVAVLSLVLIILAAMLIFIVPMFKHMYTNLGGTLPLPTRILVGVSGLGVKLLPLIIVAGFGGFLLWRRWVGTESGRGSWDSFKVRLPLIGPLVRKTALSRFSSTLSTLLGAGLPVLESLEITSEVVGCTPVARAIRDMQNGIKMGEPLSNRLGSHPIFPPMITQMMSVGEDSGAVEELLGRVAGFYEQEVEAAVSSLTSILEPLMVMVLGGVVGTMVIALYLPMFRIINLVN